MARFRRSFRRSRGRPARGSTWIPFNPIGDVAWPQAGAVVDFSWTGANSAEAIAISHEVFSKWVDPTIVRVRGDVYVTCLSQGNAAAVGGFVAVGLIEIEQGGTTQGPITDAYRDWLWIRSGYIGMRSNPTPVWNSFSNSVQYISPYQHAGDHFMRFELDARAMRKMDAGNELIVAAESYLPAGAESDSEFNVRIVARALVKE